MVMGVSVEQERAPDWQVSGAITLTSGFHKGRDSPFDRWVQGERSLPRVMERRHVLMALDGFNAQEEPRPEGCNGSAQRAPLPRLRCSTPHILRVGLIDKIGKNGCRIKQNDAASRKTRLPYAYRICVTRSPSADRQPHQAFRGFLP